MEVYLLRHGIADEPKPGLPDSSRALTSEGKRKLRDVLRAAKEAGVCPAVILTSPYRRAVETAEIARDVLGYDGELLRTQALVPGGDPEHVWDELRLYTPADQILLAGHEPLLGMTAGFLLGAPQLCIDFKKAALARIDIEKAGPAPRGVLKWMLVPKLAWKS